MILMLMVTGVVLIILTLIVGFWVALPIALAFHGGWFVFNYYENTRGLVKSNLKTYFIARIRGLTEESAADFMIRTRFSRDMDKAELAWLAYSESRKVFGTEKERICMLVKIIFQCERGIFQDGIYKPDFRKDKLDDKMDRIITKKYDEMQKLYEDEIEAKEKGAEEMQRQEGLPTNALQTALNSVMELIRHTGRSLSGNERVFLMRPVSEITESDKSEVDKLEEAMNLGFYKCAAEGYAFTEVSRIEGRFGRSLEENYPGATDAFLRFAVSYWTLKLVKEDLRRASKFCNRLIFHLLSQVEFNIASVFFPTPGLHNIPVNLREQEQRRLILSSGANIDIEEFIRGNPILSSHSIQGKRSGCLGNIALLGGIFTRRKKKLLERMSFGVDMVMMGICGRLVYRYAPRMGREKAGLLAAAVTNELFSSPPSNPKAKEFLELNGELIEKEVSNLRNDDEIRNAVTQAIRVKALILHERTGNAQEALALTEKLLKLGILVPGGETPTPDTFLPMALEFYESTPE